MERKEFLRNLVIRGGIATVIPTMALQACAKEDDDEENGPNNGDPNNGDITLDLDDATYADLKNDSGSIALSSDKIIVINTGNSNYVALSSTCTHQGCTVGYNASSNELPCPCHGSVFSTSGSVLQGPASSPLAKYSVTVDNNTLTINA
jgi:cytochrome b6-f complex iron-sulfur subunit